MRRQGRRREAGSGGSLSHSHDLTERNRIRGSKRRVSWRSAVKPETSKTGFEYMRQERGERANSYSGRPAGLLREAATETVTEREGSAGVSRGHSTEPRGEGRAEHRDTRHHWETQRRMGAETIRQLTFDWSDEGEALERSNKGLNRELASTGAGALALYGACVSVNRPVRDPHAGWCGGRGQQ